MAAMNAAKIFDLVSKLFDEHNQVYCELSRHMSGLWSKRIRSLKTDPDLENEIAKTRSAIDQELGALHALNEVENYIIAKEDWKEL